MLRVLSIIALTTALLYADPFAAGNKSLGITVGSGSISYSGGVFVTSRVENYYILGVSASYFIVDNLDIGLGYRGWFGGTPKIHQATIPVTYYMPTDSKFRPYLGAFYRYTNISSDLYDDYSSVGGRAGVAIVFRNGYAGFGWVQEVYLNTDSTSDSSSGYPEAVVGFTF